LDWLNQYSAAITALGTLAFGFTGAGFALLAHRNQKLDVRERLYQRRLHLFSQIGKAVQIGQRPGNMEWMQSINDLQVESEFLFDSGVQETVGALRCLLEQHLHLDTLDDSEQRIVRGKALREEIQAKFQEFKRRTQRYLSLGDGA
jgi:hypothetical protein